MVKLRQSSAIKDRQTDGQTKRVILEQISAIKDRRTDGQTKWPKVGQSSARKVPKKLVKNGGRSLKYLGKPTFETDTDTP